MFWGLVVFMPVGVTYLSAILLLLTLLGRAADANASRGCVPTRCGGR
jgi:hypothetical protein